MDESNYRSWWALHLRVARGESLDPKEQTAYELALARLHGGESVEAGASELRQVRAALRVLQAEQLRLNARQEERDAEIAALEALLDAGTREQPATSA